MKSMKRLSQKIQTSRNWYVRINAAKSLSMADESRWYIEEVMHGSDRYAKEELKYALSVMQNGGAAQ